MSRLEITDQAEEDLVEAALFIALDNPDAAFRFIDQVTEQYELLAASPRIGRKRDDLGPGIRSLTFGNYLIFYQEIDNGISIICCIRSRLHVSFSAWEIRTRCPCQTPPNKDFCPSISSAA